MVRKHICVFLALLGCFFNLHPLTTANAAEKFQGADVNESSFGIPAVPYRVVLSQNNARIFAQSKVHLLEAHGQKVFELPLPKDATAIELTLPKVNGESQGTIVSYSAEVADPFRPMGTLEKLRITFESKADSLSGSIAALIAKNNAIYDPIVKLPPDEARAAMEKALPDLALIETRLQSAKRELQHIKNRMAMLKDKTPLSKKLVVVIDSELKDKTELHVMYAYTLEDSKWTPMYSISANSEKNTIDVQLRAHIKQNSDMDWNNTRIELSTAAGDVQSPGELRSWVIAERNNMQRDSAPNVMMMSSPGNLRAKSSNESFSFQQNTALASWVLQKNITIAEGETTLILHEQHIKRELERIARPSNYGPRGAEDGRVWLSAEVDFKNAFLPQGKADYFLDGVAVGQNMLTPESTGTTLFFGADPLVNVDIAKTVRKSGQDGIIQREQTWVWKWTFTVYNQRKTSVKVRIEEPETQAAHEKIRVLYADSPRATKGPDNTLVWNVSVPADGKQKVERSITVKAPKDMNIFLDR